MTPLCGKARSVSEPNGYFARVGSDAALAELIERRLVDGVRHLSVAIERAREMSAASSFMASGRRAGGDGGGDPPWPVINSRLSSCPP
jgi:hypothetical protein